MSKTTPGPAAAAPATQPAFVPTHGGVYRASKTGAVKVLAGGPPAETPTANADQLPKAGEA